VECLSALTQRKGELTPEESALLKKSGLAWGCDVCQAVCPHTLRALREETIYTSVPYFTESILSHLSTDALDAMSSEDFSERAYAWRGRPTIRRNLLLLAKDAKD
jgi:epoxyqueuosine reductase QueG